MADGMRVHYDQVMRRGLRLVLLGVVSVFLLALSPAALGDGTTYQLAVPSWSSDCYGFTIETTAGTPSGCTSRQAAEGGFINGGYSAAADGSVVYMANDNTDPSAGDQGSIWLARPDGSAVHLDDSVWDMDPTISYDGSKVTFVRFDPVTWSSDIYTVNSDGSDLQLVVSGNGTNALNSAAISPDGTSIAYSCGPAQNAASAGQGCGPLTDGSYRDMGVMRVNADGTNPRMIVIGPGDALGVPQQLSWSPDSQWIAMDGTLTVYLGNDEWTTQSQLFEYQTDGSDLFNNADPTRQITHETGYGPALPQFSPDGTQVLYMMFKDDNGNQGNFAYLADVDGANRQELPIAYGAFIPTATPTAPPPLVDMTHITVPSVQSESVPAATSTLASVNLTVGTVSNSYSATVAKGSVVSQAPSAGAVAHRTEKTGPPVNLVVSRGAPPPESLSIDRSGAGSGTVSSSPSGVNCGATCSHSFAYGTSVALTATPSVGSRFAGWSGSCSGTGVCKVTMSASRWVTANFVLLIGH